MYIHVYMYLLIYIQAFPRMDSYIHACRRRHLVFEQVEVGIGVLGVAGQTVVLLLRAGRCSRAPRGPEPCYHFGQRVPVSQSWFSKV